MDELCDDAEKLRRPRAAEAAQQRGGSGASAVLDPEIGAEAESRIKVSSSKYKGVVPQPNGRWGAQIYEKHQRVWLGTFNDEDEAARAYGVAALRFRGRSAANNDFKPSAETRDDGDSGELLFLNAHSKTEIVDMLRKHTYDEELRQSKRAYGTDAGGEVGGKSGGFGGHGVLLNPLREHLFDKAVTPSDVGKLNRLVMPKQHAERHFPLEISGAASCRGMPLNFEDSDRRVWRLRYSYWKSSQSYVLTKGWSRFVKEKNLKAGDTVGFYRSSGPEKQLYIDSKPRTIMSSSPTAGMKSEEVIIRLFGVDILNTTTSLMVGGGGGVVVVDESGVGGVGWNRKRTREMGLQQPARSISLV